MLVVLSSLLLVTTVLTAADPAPAAGESGRYFELRKYYAMPGKLADLDARFRDHTCRLFEKHGMEIIGFWRPIEGPDADRTLVYILAYPDREARAASWKGFQNDPEWKAARDASERKGKIVEKIESTFMRATDYSAIK
jgi:hypothetical protein